VASLTGLSVVVCGWLWVGCGWKILLWEFYRIQPHSDGGGTEWTHGLSLPFMAGTTHCGWLWLSVVSRVGKLHITGISQSAGCIYSSAIPFMPVCKLHFRYQRYGTGVFTVCSGRLQDWPAEVWCQTVGDAYYAVAWSADGEHVCAGMDDGRILLLDPSTGNINKSLVGHTDGVMSVAFSPDCKHIASGFDDGTVVIWSVSGEREQVFDGHTACVVSVAFSPLGQSIASGSQDRTVRIWYTSGERPRIFNGHTDQVTSVAFSPDALKVVSGSVDHTIRIWSVLGEQERVLDCGQWIGSVAFSPDGQHIACGSSSDVEIWSVYGEKEHVLKGHIRTVTSVSFSPDGRYIVSGARDTTVRVWYPSCQQERLFHGHTNEVCSVAFSPDGQRVASGSWDATVRVWSPSTAQTTNANGHTTRITSVGFTVDDKHIISVSDDSIRVWSSFGEHQRGFNVHVPAAVSKDGQHIAFHVDDRTLRVRSVFGSHEMNLRSESIYYNSVDFSDDGQWIRSKSVWGDAIVRSVYTGEKVESNTIAFDEHKVRTRLIYKSGND